MKKYIQVISLSLVLCLLVISCFLTACSGSIEERYRVTVNGDEYLYESLKEFYKPGEEVIIKAKIMPRENIKAFVDDFPLTKSKNAQDDFLTFSFTMPSQDVALTLTSSKYFDEDLLVGFYLTFSDENGNPLNTLNKELTSSDAIVDYMYYYHDGDILVWTEKIGANVFSESAQSIKNNNSLSLETTLFYTCELLGATVWVDFVYFNEKTEGVSSCSGVGFHLDNLHGYWSTSRPQELFDFRYDEYGNEYREFFQSFCKLKIQYIDYLTSVNVLEYNRNNELIKTTEVFENQIPEYFIVSNECEYVIIQEEYTVMEDGERKGEKYFERTLINKSSFGVGTSLKYPRGDGLISNRYLSIKWQTDSEE